jgi:hypothetical protein
MRNSWKRIWVAVAVLVLPLLLTRCLIYDVKQPSSAARGATIYSQVKLYDDQLPSNGAETDKGVFCVQVPNDWTVDSCGYEAEEKGQTVKKKGIATLSPAWADSATRILPPPAGYKWVGLLSDSAYKYTDTLFVEVKLKMKVGNTTGNFKLGYLTTKNGSGLIYEFAQGWSDTSMGHPITVSATSVELESLGGLPAAYALGQNYPNPFNPTTIIRYAVPSQSDVRLTVVDMSGREVAVLAQGVQDAGEYLVRFAPENLASGVYFYKIQAGSFTATRKMLYVR